MDTNSLKKLSPPRKILLLVFISVLGVVGIIMLSNLVFGVPIGPCQDTLAANAPMAEFTIESHPSAEQVTASHDAGEALTASNTMALYLKFTDQNSQRTETVVWAPDGIDSFPVGRGDSVMVQWSNVGNWFGSGDTVRVVWRGREVDRPTWCPGNDPINSTFAKITLGDAS